MNSVLHVSLCTGLIVLGAFSSASCDSAPAANADGAGGSSSTPAGTGGAPACGSLDAGEVLTPEGGCTPAVMTESGTLTGPTGARNFCLGNRQYTMQVNEWNSTAGQTLSYGGDSFFKVTRQDGQTATNQGPTGYPSMFIGANGGRRTLASGLPKQVKSLSSVPTTWNWKDNGATDSSENIYNAAYDVWFSVNAAGDPTSYNPSGGYLMVWLHKPASAQPIGSIVTSSVTIPGVSGTWNVWDGMNGSVHCISYVRTESTYSLSFDLDKFIEDAVNNHPNTITADMYLTNIFIGFEIWKGGVGLETTSYCAAVN